jgi:arylsulfatase A-like enzyme
VPGRNEQLYFFDLLYAIDAVKSAHHHPEGVLWMHTGEHAIHSEPVSILDIAPTIYHLMGVRNAVGDAPARGASLVPRFRSSVQAEEKRVA